MALDRLVEGLKHLSGGPIHDQGGVFLGIGGTGQHLDQAAVAVPVKDGNRRFCDQMAAVMGGRSRSGQANGEKKGGAKAGQEAEPTR